MAIVKNTRKDDLGYLEEGRDRFKGTMLGDHIEAGMVAVYEQSKDPTLERARRELVDALKMQNMQKIDEIRKRVQKYVLSPKYISEMANKVRLQAGETSAKLYIAGQERLKKEVIKNGNKGNK